MQRHGCCINHGFMQVPGSGATSFGPALSGAARSTSTIWMGSSREGAILQWAVGTGLEESKSEGECECECEYVSLRVLSKYLYAREA